MQEKASLTPVIQRSITQARQRLGARVMSDLFHRLLRGCLKSLIYYLPRRLEIAATQVKPLILY
jgi:hypothetical protein